MQLLGTIMVGCTLILALGASFTGRSGAAPAGEPAKGFMAKTVSAAGQSLDYVVYVPRSYDAATPMPAIVFLHGRGECGTDGTRQLLQGLPPSIMYDNSRWPFIVVIPQKPDPAKQWAEYEGAVLAALDATVREYGVDEDRVYLTGLSQGGAGTWAIAASNPGRFAAIAPICGYGDPAAIAPGVKDLPIWAFHGEADNVVPPERTTAIVEAVRAAGGEPRYSLYPGVNHGSWDRAYGEAELPGWFLSHRRNADAGRGRSER